MSAYTLTEHSGLGTVTVEEYHVGGASEERVVRAAGGVLLPTYGVAADLAEAVTQYADGAVSPAWVVGTFSVTTFRGMRLWIPDEWARTLVRLGDDCEWRRPVPELAALAEAVVAPAQGAPEPLAATFAAGG